MIEGVRDLIEVKTADMRSLPFTDETFEVVTSTWAVHNLEDVTDRQKAIVEMVRVLKKNGLLILADIANQDEYAVILRSSGMSDLKKIDYVFGRWILEKVSFGSFSPSALTARKPAE